MRRATRASVTGKPPEGGDFAEKDVARFWAKVALPNEQGCMLWRVRTSDQGYGVYSIKSRQIPAHRFSYILAYGPIPEGLVIDHVKAKGCTNRHCVAPEHLEAVTHSVNSLRGETGKHWQKRTHCPEGHPYAGENLHMRTNGVRQCRECARASQRARRSLAKARRQSAT